MLSGTPPKQTTVVDQWAGRVLWCLSRSAPTSGVNSVAQLCGTRGFGRAGAQMDGTCFGAEMTAGLDLQGVAAGVARRTSPRRFGPPPQALASHGPTEDERVRVEVPRGPCVRCVFGGRGSPPSAPLRSVSPPCPPIGVNMTTSDGVVASGAEQCVSGAPGERRCMTNSSQVKVAQTLASRLLALDVERDAFAVGTFSDSFEKPQMSWQLLVRNMLMSLAASTPAAVPLCQNLELELSRSKPC